MTIDLQQWQVPADEPALSLEELLAGFSNGAEAEVAVEADGETAGVAAVARALDRLRAVTAKIGPMTLRAEVYGVPSELICAALDEITRTSERVLRDCLEP